MKHAFICLEVTEDSTFPVMCDGRIGRHRGERHTNA